MYMYIHNSKFNQIEKKDHLTVSEHVNENCNKTMKIKIFLIMTDVKCI